jgi:Condensin complex subunit 2
VYHRYLAIISTLPAKNDCGRKSGLQWKQTFPSFPLLLRIAVRQANVYHHPPHLVSDCTPAICSMLAPSLFCCSQVDIRALKDIMWGGFTDVPPTQDAEPVVPFQALLNRVPPTSRAGHISDLSVHLCFMCVLHLANEHGLHIEGTASMTGMAISNPAAPSRRKQS